NAGTYTIYLSEKTNGNYVISNDSKTTATLTVKKATVGTPTIQSKEYNGELQTADVPVRSYYTVIENNGGTNIGTYNVKLRLVDSANTQWASTPNADITLSFSITKITTIISDLVLDGWTYGEQAKSPTANINHNTAITYTYSKDGVTYTSAVPSEPGTYYVKASVGETDNYTADEETKTFKISRIVVTKPAKDETKYVYDGTEKTYSLQTSTLYTITSDGLTQINAGTYPITIALNDTVHYQWDDYSDTALVYNFVIEKASIANATITLGNADNLVYNAREHTVTITGVYVNEKALSSSDYTVETSLTQTNAGNHAVTIKGQGNYTGSATTKFTIAKLTISKPEANSTPFVYNGTEQTYTIVENAAYTITGNKQTNAGEYKVVVELKDKQNCQWDNKTTENLEYDFIIEKGATAITNFTMSGWTYGETASTPSATTNFGTIVYTYYNSDGTKLDSAPTNAGTYTVVASVEGTDNYTAAETQPVEFTIAKQEVEFTLDFVAGDEGTIENGVYTWTYNGNEHTLVVTSSIPSVSLVLSKSITDVIRWSNQVTFTIAEVTFANEGQANNYTIKGNKQVKLSLTPLKVRVYNQVLDSYTFDSNPNGVTWANLAANVIPTTQVATGTQLVKEIKYTNTTDSALTKLDGNLTIGSTFKIVYEPTDNFDFQGVNYCYLKYRTAKVGETWYTIEDAIANIGESTITLAGNHSSYVVTSFTQLQGISGITGLENYSNSYTISAGTLLVPFEGTLNWKADSKGATISSGNVYAVLNIPQGITLNFNGGNLVIGAQLGSTGDITTYQCNRGVLVNDGTININSGSTMEAYGYVKSTLITNADGTKDTVGWINITDGAELTEAMHVLDWVGGSTASRVYRSAFPSNAWSIHTIACKTRIYSGSLYYGFVHAIVSDTSYTAKPLIVGLADSENALFKPGSISVYNYVEKVAKPAALWGETDDKYKALYADFNDSSTIKGHHLHNGQKEELKLYGTYTDGKLVVSVNGVAMATSQSISLPIGYMDISLTDGATLTLSSSDYLFLPGTKLTVESGATLNISSGTDVAFLDYAKIVDLDNYTDENHSFIHFIVDINKDAYIDIKGTVNVSGGIGGKVVTTGENAFLNLSGATLTASYTTKTAEYGGVSAYTKTLSTTDTCKAVYGMIGTSAAAATSSPFDKLTYVSKTLSTTECYWTSASGYDSYKIVYHYYGDVGTTQTFYYTGDAPTITAGELPSATRQFYSFEGWYTDQDCTKGREFTSATVSNELEINLYAKWEKIVFNVEYIVYSDELGGTVIPTTDYTNESKTTYTVEDALVLQQASLDSMKFKGWYLQNPLDPEDFIEITEGITSWPITIDVGTKIKDYTLGLDLTDFTLHATLRDLQEFTVNYWAQTTVDDDTWINIGTETVLEEECITITPDSKLNTFNDDIKYKHFFDTDNWYTDISCEANKAFNASKAITENKDLYAKRENKTSITIGFITEKGTVDPTGIEGWATIVGMQVQLPTPTCEGHTFEGWYSSAETAEAATDDGRIGSAGETYTATANTTLYAGWTVNEYTITVTTSNATVKVNGTTVNNNGTVKIQYGTQVTVDVTYSKSSSRKTTITGTDETTYNSPFNMPAQDVKIHAKSEDLCIAAGTLITMADGTTKKVENVNVGDIVMIFNHETGRYESGIVTTNAHNEVEWGMYEIINLEFDDGTKLRIINEHILFNYTLMQYVPINLETMYQYVGDEMASAKLVNGEYVVGTKKLVKAYLTTEYTGIYNPVTYFHLNCVAEGLLTMPGAITNVLNVFEYDSNLKYNEEQKAKDIETYGLFTYETFSHLISEEVFNALPLNYMKVAIAKGNITEEEMFALVAHFQGVLDSSNPQTTTTDVAEATLPPQVVTGDEQQQDTVEGSIE
ncbi:MAG: InlB B-repeat-containing protein, partial [Clostridia bacterium]|nr:InlB B-repeat-containing protein [Clostridia bacterium]